MCATPALFHFFTPAQVIKLIIIFAQTNNDNRPSRDKELVLLCMDYRYYDYDDATNTAKFKFREKMVWIGCPDCKGQAAYKYSVDFPVKHGFTNPSNHFVTCVGSNNNMMKIIQARQNAKLLQKDQDERSKTASKQPLLQQTLSCLNFLPSECILSIEMWITKIVLEDDGELKDIITKVFDCGAHVRNSCKVSTCLQNKASAVDPRLTNVSAKSESATCQWLGAAITMKQHIKIQPFLVELVKDRIGKMRDHQECVKMSFMDKVGYHYKYMKTSEVAPKICKSMAFHFMIAK